MHICNPFRETDAERQAAEEKILQAELHKEWILDEQNERRDEPVSKYESLSEYES